ncbi:MAG: hypothetical protein ABSC64_00165 [Candidatus Korobacteraceae bacterium]
MKNQKSTKREPAEDVQEAMDLLFGSEAELTNDELEADLNDLGVDTKILARHAHRRLLDLANHHFSSLSRQIPAEMSKALSQLKPPTPEQQAAETSAGADSRVKSILAAAKSKTSSFVESLAAGTKAQPEYAFRNKGELTDSDTEILESGQEELNHGSSDPGKKGHHG